MVPCPSCKGAVPDDAHFCGHCGNALPLPVSRASPLPVPSPPPPPPPAPAPVLTLTPAGGPTEPPGAPTITVPPSAVALEKPLRVAQLPSTPRSPDKNLVVVSPVFALDAGPGGFAADVLVT